MTNLHVRSGDGGAKAFVVRIMFQAKSSVRLLYPHTNIIAYTPSYFIAVAKLVNSVIGCLEILRGPPNATRDHVYVYTVYVYMCVIYIYIYIYIICIIYLSLSLYIYIYICMYTHTYTYTDHQADWVPGSFSPLSWSEPTCFCRKAMNSALLHEP